MTAKTNKVVRVSFSGGLLGLIFGSHRGKLEKAISAENRNGWNLAEVLDDNPNLVLILIRLLLLLLTLGLWTLSVGYSLVFERPIAINDKEGGAKTIGQGNQKPVLRVEPKLR